MSWVAAAADNGGNASRQQTEEAQQKKISKVKWNCHHKGNPLLQSVILKSLRLPLALKNSTRSFLKSPSAKYLRVLNVEIEIVLQPYNRLCLSKKSTPKLSGGGVWCDSDHPFFCHIFKAPTQNWIAVGLFSIIMRWVNEKCVIWEPLAYHFLCTGRCMIHFRGIRLTRFDWLQFPAPPTHKILLEIKNCSWFNGLLNQTL